MQAQLTEMMLAGAVAAEAPTALAILISRKEVVAPQNELTPEVAAVPLTEYKVSTQHWPAVVQLASEVHEVYAVVAPAA